MPEKANIREGTADNGKVYTERKQTSGNDICGATGMMVLAGVSRGNTIRGNTTRNSERKVAL